MHMSKRKQDVLSVLPDLMREIREATHISQTELAQKLGLSRQYIAQWEKGQSTPSREQLSQWVKMLHQEIQRLVASGRVMDKAIILVERNPYVHAGKAIAVEFKREIKTPELGNLERGEHSIRRKRI